MQNKLARRFPLRGVLYNACYSRAHLYQAWNVHFYLTLPLMEIFQQRLNFSRALKTLRKCMCEYSKIILKSSGR